MLREQANVNVIRRKSMRSRPGALKRREKMDQGERERFAKNLAEMAGKGVPQQQGSIEDRNDDAQGGQQPHNSWAALRRFIAQTLEQRPDVRELNN